MLGLLLFLVSFVAGSKVVPGGLGVFVGLGFWAAGNLLLFALIRAFEKLVVWRY